MADAELSIIIKARNEAKAEFDKLDKQVKGLQGGTGGLNTKLGELNGKFQSITGMSLGFATAAGAAGMAVKGLWEFLKSSVEETVAYQSEVRDLSRLLGLNTEETSRLVQASDDLFISQESLVTAMQAATRKGVDTSIDGLKRLSAQYLTLNGGVERGKFLMDNFGRSGADMGKLMEVGADGISKAMAAINDSLVVTEQSLQATENYKRSVDNLTDAWAGFKMQVGNEIIPQLDLLIRQFTKGKDEIELQQEAIGRLNEQLVQLKKYGGMSGLTAEEVAIQMKALTDEIARLKAEALGATTGTDGLTGSVTALGTETSTVTQYFKQLTTEMLWNKIAAGMTEEAAMSLAWEWGLVDAQTFGAYKAVERLNRIYDLNKDGVIDAKEATEDYRLEVKGLKTQVDLLHDKTIDVTVNMHSNGSLGGGYLPVFEEEQAAGGPVSGNTPYLVGEVGPEIFVPSGSGTIIPNNRLGGGGASIVINYSSALSLSNQTEAETVLVPLIKQALARA